MNTKLLLRPVLAIVLGFIGALIARNVTANTIFSEDPKYLLLVVAAAFGTLGFILSDILELAGKAGVAALARQIVGYLPSKTYSPFRFRRTKSSEKYPNPLILDTSAIIDGRLLEIVRTGFVSGTLIVTPAVISELQKLADSADDQKRIRGRRGLDILEEIKKVKSTKLEVLSNDVEAKSVDDMLVKLALTLKGKIVTVDYNLNKVAKVRGLSILNVNELANAVKTVVLPSERLSIQITSSGKEKDQGVGYLSDGTMVVVEGGEKYKGREVQVKVHRVLQTAAGKMIFARPPATGAEGEVGQGKPI